MKFVHYNLVFQEIDNQVVEDFHMHNTKQHLCIDQLFFPRQNVQENLKNFKDILPFLFINKDKMKE